MPKVEGVGTLGFQRQFQPGFVFFFSHLKISGGPRTTDSPGLSMRIPRMQAGLLGLKQGKAHGNQDRLVTLEGPKRH